MNTDVAALRTDYARADLDEASTAPDPFDQFARWFDEAVAAQVPEPNAMTLATATPEGRPSARIVLLKGFGPEGFTFYTNFESRKGRELDANPHAALVFWWHPLERQVRIEGSVGRAPAEVAEAYFASRPRGSQLGAHVSPQSRPLDDRAALEAAFEAARTRFGDGAVPRPPHWGGYVLAPVAVEFWQGRPSRLHDRIVYRRAADGAWRRTRLAP